MKTIRLLLLGVIGFLTVSCGPTIILNNTSHGARQVLTSNLKIGSVKNVGDFYVALGAKIEGRDSVLAILVTCNADSKKSIFAKGDKFRIGFSDGTELALQNIFENEFEEESGTRVTHSIRNDYGYLYSYGPFTDSFYVEPYTISRMVPEVTTYKETNSYALYLISRRDASIIAKKSTVKIRIESSMGDLDVADPEKIGDVFMQLGKTLFPVIEQNYDSAF